MSETDYGSNPYNVLQFGGGITPAMVHVTSDGDSIFLTVATNGDTVHIDGMMRTGLTYGLEAISFADGTVWSRQQVMAHQMAGTSGNDVLNGTSGADTFDGKGGADQEIGNGGGDTFLFDLGYGFLRISETDYASSPYNILSFGGGIAPSVVKVTSDGTAIFLTIGTNGDTVHIDGMLSSGPTNGVQPITFADGTVWSRARSSRWR